MQFDPSRNAAIDRAEGLLRPCRRGAMFESRGDHAAISAKGLAVCFSALARVAHRAAPVPRFGRHALFPFSATSPGSRARVQAEPGRAASRRVRSPGVDDSALIALNRMVSTAFGLAD